MLQSGRQRKLQRQRLHRERYTQGDTDTDLVEDFISKSKKQREILRQRYVETFRGLQHSQGDRDML